MKNILKLQDYFNNSTAVDAASLFVLRLILFIVILPHGAQLLLGWFGGNGFTGTMNYFTQVAGFPYIIGLLVILIQFFSPLMLLAGIFTRINAIAILIIFTGMIPYHLEYGFFMNWFGSQKGEGYEFHLLVIAIAAALMLKGGGQFSLYTKMKSKIAIGI